MTWLTRDDLAGPASGLLIATSDTVVPIGDLTGFEAGLRAAGVGENDRVVVALAEPVGAQWATAAASVAEAGASVGPRGRMRLHHALEAVGATTLVITPTGAMDFLARLHLEFLLDPLDLGLRHIVLTGEIASRRTLPHLASEFETAVTEVYASPFSGVPLAWRAAEDDPLTVLEPGTLGLASLEKDAPYAPPGPAELVIHTPDATLRTGQVATPAGDEIPAPSHTVGEHVLVRGQWISLPRVTQALSRIDGISRWDLRISREGTLDAAALHVTFNRDTLIKNPMWKSRVAQSLVAITPVAIEVVIEDEVAEDGQAGTVTDLRGHHLGRDRS